ncbi:MAG: DUF1269 domain-containing protein [Anaerolineae bacterium]|nr:DUF1269 domain-containing protein [Anaerolineae bacterium]
MGSKLIDVVVAAFDDESAATATMDRLAQIRREGRVAIKAMAIVRRDEGGHLHIKETDDPGAVRGAIVGGAVGGIIGLLLGPLIIPAAAAGAAIGALTEKLHDAGIPDDKLQRLGEGLRAGAAAVVVMTTAEDSAETLRVLHEAGARVVAEGLNEYTYQKLAAIVESP